MHSPKDELSDSKSRKVVPDEFEYDRHLSLLLARMTQSWHSLMEATEGFKLQDSSLLEEKKIYTSLLANVRKDFLPHYRKDPHFMLEPPESFAPPFDSSTNRLNADFAGDVNKPENTKK